MQNEINTLNLSSLRLVGQYSCGAYGANAYDSACTTSSTGADTGDFLADTGYNILLPIALGVAVVIAGIILLVKRLRRLPAGHK